MSKYWVNLFVKLKIPDAEAATAANTLRRHLGYGDKLKGLRKEALWSIQVDASDEKEAEKLGHEFAKREIVNDNKESYRLEVGREKDKFETKNGLLVRLKIEDATAATTMATLKNRLGYGEKIKAVRRATVWYPESDSDLRQKIAKDLLFNPSKDEYLLL